MRRATSSGPWESPATKAIGARSAAGFSNEAPPCSRISASCANSSASSKKRYGRKSATWPEDGVRVAEEAALLRMPKSRGIDHADILGRFRDRQRAQRLSGHRGDFVTLRVQRLPDLVGMECVR